MPSYFFKVAFKPLPSNCKIFSHAIMQDHEKEMKYFVAGNENGSERFSIAINPFLLACPPENMKGVYLKDIIKEAGKDASEPPFLILGDSFSKIEGKVEMARTFCFGGHLLAEIFLKKAGEEELIRIAFFPNRRQRKQGLTLVGKKIRVCSSSIETKIRGKNKIWNGKNF